VCHSAEACPAGTKQTAPPSGTSPAVCLACEAGTYCPGGAVDATACSSGTWDDDSDAATQCVAQTTCAAGSHVSTPGDATTDRACTVCSPGTFSTTANANLCAAWASCQAGRHVTADGSTTQDRACGTCPEGTFTATENAPSCSAWKDCAAGSYVSNVPSSEADRECAACASGTTTILPNQAQCLEPAPPTGNLYIRNRWTGVYLHASAGKVATAAAPGGTTYQWVLENKSGFKRIKNVGSGCYIHVEGALGHAECTVVPDTYFSSYWTVGSVAVTYSTLQNYYTGNPLHDEGSTGFAQTTWVPPYYQSSQWALVAP
jgi:hypothetical protein